MGVHIKPGSPCGELVSSGDAGGRDFLQDQFDHRNTGNVSDLTNSM